MKRILKDYFTFSKKERVAVIILLLLIGAFIIAPYFFTSKLQPPLVNKELQQFIAQQKSVTEPHENSVGGTAYVKPVEVANKVTRKLFYFDPNTVAAEGWKQLGIADKTIQTILNYRNKGGKFKTAEDIRKIWGLKKDDADAIISYVQIAETAGAQYWKNKSTQKLTLPTSNKQTLSIIDINSATIEQWESLPGIGAVLANRIVKFRERLGGFHALEQIQKTYGISDSVYRLILPFLRLQTEAFPGKVNLNKASTFDLTTKAGIPVAVARSIIVYRQQYGPFQSVEELKKLVFITDTLFARIAPNLIVGNDH